MPYIRLRYPLLMIVVGIIALSSLKDQEQIVFVQPTPTLEPGYYVVLHTDAKLPKEIIHKSNKEKTYVGPLPHIKACHENRAKVRPLYPGVETELVKINTQ